MTQAAPFTARFDIGSQTFLVEGRMPEVGALASLLAICVNAPDARVITGAPNMTGGHLEQRLRQAIRGESIAASGEVSE